MKFTLVLLLVLVISNILWAYAYLNLAVTLKYRTIMVRERSLALADAVLVMPKMAHGKTQDDLVPILRSVLRDEGFEKDGALWIGMLGFEFDDQRLVDVTPNFPIGEWAD